MSWTRAIHLIHWADTQEARYTLPLLLRRLIRRTVPSLIALNFPAAEQAQRPGFDGVVETREGNEFVPAGISNWEIGVEREPRRKAEADFEKRVAKTLPQERKQAVFLFVTPRVWLKKDEWAKQKASQSDWRGVAVLDANDLEHWLELAPGVDVWFTRVSGRVSEGVQDLQSYWNALRAIAQHQLTPSVFTASRDAEIAIVQKWLAGLPSSLLMKTWELTEGLDFLAGLSANDQNEKLQNALIVHTNEAWRQLRASREALVLAAAPTLELGAPDTAGAVASGHHVFVSAPHGTAGQGVEEATLARQDHLSITQALRESGFSESRAIAISKACCGSSSILKRLITRHPETRFPAWARDDARSTVAPFALVGGWTHVDSEASALRIGAPPPLDLWVVTQLMGCGKQELDALVGRWQRDSEPLFLRLGTSVLVSSREDAWHLLGGSITEEQLRRFRELALLVLEEEDPAFQLAPDKRWLAKLYGKTRSLSGELRRSIVETLALMATYPTVDAPDASVDFNGSVRWVLEQAMPRHATWQRWASFGFNLTVIAEAAPELFLTRVEEDLRSGDPELPKLFQDQRPSLFGGALHTDLLWALEGLAWSPEYLARVAVVLAKLAARDPGGTYSNRPGNTLRELFLLWLWHTNASIDDRLRALVQVVDAEPEVGWKLLTDIFPSGAPSHSQNTHLPRWRNWAEGWSRAKLQPQITQYALAIANLTLELAGSNLRRWSQVIDGMLRFSPEITGRVFAALETIGKSPENDQDELFSLWDVLRKLSTRHERYSDAGWAFPKELRDRLAGIRDTLEPSDPILRHHWLFGQHVSLPGFDPVKDHEARDRAVCAARIEALREIVSTGGADGVLRLLSLIRNASAAGWLLGQERLLTSEQMGLPAILDSPDERQVACAQSYILSRYHREGWSFINITPVLCWSAQQIGAFARCLPFCGEVWSWVRKCGVDAEREYWQRVRGFLREPHFDQVRIACQSLMSVGRPFTAAEVLHSAASQKMSLPSDLIADVLEPIFRAENNENLAEMRDVVQYELQELVKFLQQDKAFDQARLAAIEWGLLPLLDRDFGETGPDTLIRETESKPEFFVHLLTLTYRSEKEPPPDSPLPEQEALRARYAGRLLSGLRKLPGTHETGAVDYDYLRQWTEQVRSMAAACDRLGICDLTLGEIFARACKKTEGNWPSLEVAELVEAMGTREFFEGFESGIVNSRGAVTRSAWAGGSIERRMADEYRQLAQYVRTFSPKIANAFLRLAEHYEAHARHEDADAERGKLGR